MSRDLVALTEAQSAGYAWATPRYLRRCVAERRLPFHKIGGRVYFDRADLDAHAEAGRVEPPTPVRLPGRDAAPGASRGRHLTVTATTAKQRGSRAS